MANSRASLVVVGFITGAYDLDVPVAQVYGISKACRWGGPDILGYTHAYCRSQML